MEENDIATKVIGAAIEVHRTLGPGLLESAYHQCLIHELRLQGLEYETEAPIVITYKGRHIDEAYRVDLLVENKVVVELKAVDCLMDIHKAQLLTYLRCLDRWLGLLINFNETILKSGVRRLVNNL
jgi:GxxExxY protein